MNAFCDSVNFDAFMRFRSSPSQESLAENSSFKRSSYQEAEQTLKEQTNAKEPFHRGANHRDDQGKGFKREAIDPVDQS
ncbi:hypothetical protein [Mameliella sp.]|uniref:hypothetical protein n=1 Tax=Mameliella sp. TaxID=1924940 RepID=UPI003BAD6545